MVAGLDQRAGEEFNQSVAAGRLINKSATSGIRELPTATNRTYSLGIVLADKGPTTCHSGWQVGATPIITMTEKGEAENFHKRVVNVGKSKI